VPAAINGSAIVMTVNRDNNFFIKVEF